MAGDAEPVQFVAVGISLTFGALGAGAQVGAQLLAFAGRLGPHLIQHLAGVGADPLGLGLGSAGGGLRTCGLLPGVPGSVLGGGCRLAGLLPLRVGGADTLLGVSAGLGDGGIPLGSGGGHPLVSLGVGLPNRFVPLVL